MNLVEGIAKGVVNIEERAVEVATEICEVENADIISKEITEKEFDVSDIHIVDDEGNVIGSNENYLQPNTTFALNGVEYITNGDGKVVSVDGIDIVDRQEITNVKEVEHNIERENPEKQQMEPPCVVEFKCDEKYDKSEYERQITNQQNGMNNISIHDFIENRNRYKENGRDKDAGEVAQMKMREEARADRIAENRENGMTRKQAELEADEWLEGQAALHDPDQIAGGDPKNVVGLGDRKINSSIGAQWKNRIDTVDNAVNKYVKDNNLIGTDLRNIYLNVKLEVA